MRVPRVYQRAIMLLLFFPTRNSRHIGEVHKYIYVLGIKDETIEAE